MSTVSILAPEMLLVGKEMDLKQNWAVLVEETKIKEIAPKENLIQKYPEISVEEYPGKCMLPGLIDCHVHLMLYCGVPNYLEMVKLPEGEQAFTITRNLLLDLYSGVTYVRCMGDRFYLDITASKLIKEGKLTGPNLSPCGYGIRSSGGHGYNGVPTDGVDEVTKRVRENIANGAEWIKFYITGMWPAHGLIQCFYSMDEIKAMVDVAHRAGIPVTCHNIGGQALDDVLAAGIDCVEHAYFTTEKQIEMMQKNGNWVCLTASEYLTEKPCMVDWYKNRLLPYRPQVRECLSNIVKAGIPFVLGTDGMHGDFYMEMKYATEFGATEKMAIQAATINAAKMLKIDDSRGSVEEGKEADLVIVQGNPLENILAMKDVAAVYQGGVCKFSRG